MGMHPHGTYLYQATLHWYSNKCNPFFRRFPFLVDKIHGTAASVVLMTPIVREMFLSVGTVDASRKTLEKLLGDGRSVSIAVGGEAECLAMENNKDILVLGGRKGFVRLALRYGADLVPTYCFHLNDTFHVNKTFLAGLRSWIQRTLKWSIPVFWGWYGTPMPRPAPLCMVVGKNIPVPQPKEKGAPVDEALVDQYHARYVTELSALFERYKGTAGYPESRVLQIQEAPEAKRAEKKQH
mmetsp:Transcript_1069/g.1784  ORF Transcript_1069/g.1784 Transcript_1069/m.1784 type:complete len:239 (-) Transcript_1069:110-826(-)